MGKRHCRCRGEAVTRLTPELASRMLDVYRWRLLDAPNTQYTRSLLDVALGSPNEAVPFMPYRKHREFAAGLKRPKWKHAKGSRS